MDRITLPTKLREKISREIQEKNCVSYVFFLLAILSFVVAISLFRVNEWITILLFIVGILLIYFGYKRYINVGEYINEYEEGYVSEKQKQLRKEEFLSWEVKIKQEFGEPDSRDCVSFRNFDNEYEKKCDVR